MKRISIKALALSLLFSTIICIGMKRNNLTPQNPTLPSIQLKGHDGAIITTLFSPNGKFIASGSNNHKNNLILWENKTGILLHNLIGHTKSIQSLKFMPESTRLISGSLNKKNNLKLWCTETGKQLYELAYHKNSIVSTDCNQNGLIVSASSGDKNNLALWNGHNGTLLYELNGHLNGCSKVQFHSDGNTFASSNPSWSGGQLLTVFIWNTKGEQLKKLCYTDVNINLAFNNNLTQCATSRYYANNDPFNNNPRDNCILVLWNTDTDKNFPHNVFLGHTDEITHVAFSKDNNTIASGSLDKKNTLLLWDNKTGNLRYSLIGQYYIFTTTFSPNNQYLLSSSGPNDGNPKDKKNLMLWNCETGKLEYNLIGHSDTVYTAAFDPQGEYIISSGSSNENDNGELILWHFDQEKK